LRHNVALGIGAHSTVPAPPEFARQPIDVLDFFELVFHSDPAGQPSMDSPQMLRYNSAHLYQPADFARREHAGATTRQDAGVATGPDAVVKTRYDKHHLVPFGEYLPFRTSWPDGFRFLRQLTPMSLLNPGDDLRPLVLRTAEGRSFRFAVAICYEDVIPQAVRRLAYDDAGQKKVDFLVNISNDGWFLGTTEPGQHMVSAVFRAVECGLPVIRSVNGGYSAVIDPLGRVTAVMPPGKTGHLSAVLLMDRRATIYGRVGDVPGFVCIGLLFAGMVVVFVMRRAAKRAASSGVLGRRSAGFRPGK